MKSDFALAFNEIVEARALPREKVLEALKQAIVSAYRRDVRVIDSQQIEAEIDPDGHPRVLVEKEVVDDVINEQTEVILAEARKIDPTIALGDTLMVPVATSKTFGRIAAQTAKQVILQHIREAERETLFGEYVEREGELTIGTIQNINNGTVTIDLGRTEAIMPASHRSPNDRYRQHQKIRVYIAEVKKTNRGPQIIVSRNHKNMLRRLLEYEVPEIYNGQIEIMSIAREAGQRSKVAVMARQEGIDAVGACVGMRGIRIQNIVKELNDEKIDIIEWDADPSRYIARALSPARVSKVILEEDLDNIRTATVIVPEDQLSQAIGKEGQNARLAAKLTGWRIDIKSVVEAAQQNLEKVEDYPLSDLLGTHPELLTDAYRILAKRADNRVVTPEEYSVLKQFVDLAETRLYEHREHARRERREMIEAVRPLVPAAAFHMPLKELELAPDIMAVIERLVNVGELWVRFMADETGLATMLAEGKAGSDAMEAIGYALDDLVIPEVYEEEAAQAAAQAEAEAASAPAPGEVATSDSEADISLPDPTDEAGEVSPERYKKAEDETDPDYESYLEVEEEEDSDIDSLAKKDSQNKKKKSKQKRRQLVYDEEVGEVVAKRRRKRSGDGDDYDEFL